MSSHQCLRLLLVGSEETLRQTGQRSCLRRLQDSGWGGQRRALTLTEPGAWARGPSIRSLLQCRGVRSLLTDKVWPYSDLDNSTNPPVPSVGRESTPFIRPGGGKYSRKIDGIMPTLEVRHPFFVKCILDALSEWDETLIAVIERQPNPAFSMHLHFRQSCVPKRR